MLTFLEVGFGGNLVQGFRAYAWRAVPNFPQIALWGPSLAFWPQPFWYNLVRTFVSGTEFCLDVQSSLYLICNPSIKPGPLYQVGNNIQNGGQFTRTRRVKYCCWVIEDIESEIHIRSHALAKRRNFKMKGHQVVIWLDGSLGSIIFVFAPFYWAGFQYALGIRWCRTKRDVSEILLLRCTPWTQCLSGAGTFYHY